MLLGEGMLELELGELGGGCWLLLDEQPASAMLAPSSRAGANRLARLSRTSAVEKVWSIMISPPLYGPKECGPTAGPGSTKA